MKERKHSIDKLFHESLSGHKLEPSASVWASLSGHIPAARGREGLLYLAAAIIIGAFSIFTISELTSDFIPSNTIENELTTPVTEPDQSMTQAEAESLPEQPEEDQSEQKSADNITATDPSYSHSDVTKPDPVASSETENSTTTSISTVAGGSMKTQDQATIDYQKLDLLDYRIGRIELNEDIDMQMEEVRNCGKPIFGLSLTDGYAKKADIIFGAAFAPAVNIYPDGQNRNDYSLEFIAAYENSRFILESGVGGNYTTESAQYAISYTSYDSIGYFINVNSFSTVQGNPDSIQFETSMKNVYDSVDHYNIKENTNKYAYLQIPLRLGYRVLEKDRFSLDIKLGILFSLQVYKDIPDVPYEGNDIVQIEVVRFSPDRLKTNWQYTAGIGMNYQITKDFRLTLEPFYRQYIKSVYSPGSDYSARSPFAFGLRGGIYFHF